MDYTLITCHFGDPFWITHTLAKVDALSDARVARVIVVDQSRESADWLAGLPRVSDVLTFPVDEGGVARLGHDHPESLNRALSSVELSTSHVIVLDSDCFPLDATWLDRLDNVTLASDPHLWALSHPCLMAFPATARGDIDFAEGIAGIGIDTGRLVALQLANAGYTVNFSRPTPAFRGYRGHFYLDGAAYHHGSASFVSSTDERLTRQVNQEREAIFRGHVERDEYDFDDGEFRRMRMKGALRRVGRRFSS